MIRYEHCPVCGSASITKVLSASDHTVSGEMFEIWQCAVCSLRFTQNVPAPETIGKYYQSENYISHSNSSKGLVNRLYLSVRRITLSLKKNLVCTETGMSTGRLLDVGAGSGAFVSFMKKSGWDADGIEPDEGAIRKAAALYGIQLKQASELNNLSSAQYDAVTLWHVLEHVHDLHGYISRIRMLCRHTGKIFIAVPNYTSDDAVRYGNNWAAYDVPRHLYHFSAAAMNTLMQKHGCTIERIQPMWFDSFYVSLLSEKYRSGRSRLLSGFLSGLRSNTKALSKRRRASSLIYIIKPHV